MGEQHALGLAGAAGGVLDEGRIRGVAVGAGDRGARRRQLVRRHDVPQRRYRRLEQAHHGPRARDRDRAARRRRRGGSRTAGSRTPRGGRGGAGDRSVPGSRAAAGCRRRSAGSRARWAASARPCRRVRCRARAVRPRRPPPRRAAGRTRSPARASRCPRRAGTRARARDRARRGATASRPACARPCRWRSPHPWPGRASGRRSGSPGAASRTARARPAAVSTARQLSSSGRPKARSRRATSSTRSRLPRPISRSSEAVRRDGALGARAARLARQLPHDVEDALDHVVRRWRRGVRRVGHERHSMCGPPECAIAAEKDEGRGTLPAPSGFRSETARRRCYRQASLAALATTNFSRLRAGILIASPVCGLRPMRAL